MNPSEFSMAKFRSQILIHPHGLSLQRTLSSPCVCVYHQIAVFVLYMASLVCTIYFLLLLFV